MTRASRGTLVALLSLVGLLAPVLGAHADSPLPPWTDPSGVPLPAWARSVVPPRDARGRPGDLVLFADPSRAGDKRGVSRAGATLPVYGAHAGSGCSGAWLLVGPLAWACSDGATLSPDEAQAPSLPLQIDGLQARYFFVGKQGASAYASLEDAAEGTADRELDGGWAVAVVDERVVEGQRWLRTSKGLWIAARDLGAARPSAFHGQTLGEGPVDLGWVVTDGAPVFSSAAPRARTKTLRARFELVQILEQSGPFVRVGEAAWLQVRDVARPSVVAPPAEVTGSAERWIDVELASQTLVAYEGVRPVYATIVSTGRGPVGTDAATPPGVHRIWVKLAASDMANVDRSDLEEHYSLEDVPYVQFFDHAVGLHGTYWHHDFGHVHSHGCVNLAPLDARWLFDFTGPRLPPGWSASYPTAVDLGTVVRVR